MKARVAVLAAFIGTLWIVRALDSLSPGAGSVAGHGIVPRTWIGLYGILTAPLIHYDWSHLIANTTPLIILSAIILLRGVEELAFAMLVTALVSGAGTWLFGSSAEHIGASGLVLGFTSFLLFRSAFDRRLSSFVITLVVAGVYATTVVLSLIPHGWFSWTMHFFGFVGGIVAARLRYPARRRHALRAV
ncbi:MAG TPA: rhomboid family intramembrane serine protease [Thermoanaerobaculia bacterium]|nr:rhomboid family intramembrane serine protease [Thermoanaerobaculia bacterium]